MQALHGELEKVAGLLGRRELPDVRFKEMHRDKQDRAATERLLAQQGLSRSWRATLEKRLGGSVVPATLHHPPAVFTLSEEMRPSRNAPLWERPESYR